MSSRVCICVRTFSHTFMWVSGWKTVHKRCRIVFKAMRRAKIKARERGTEWMDLIQVLLSIHTLTVLCLSILQTERKRGSLASVCTFIHTTCIYCSCRFIEQLIAHYPNVTYCAATKRAAIECFQCICVNEIFSVVHFFLLSSSLHWKRHIVCVLHVFCWFEFLFSLSLSFSLILSLYLSIYIFSCIVQNHIPHHSTLAGWL